MYIIQELIIRSGFYLAIILIILVPFFTLKKLIKTKRYVPSIFGIVYSLILIFYIAPNEKCSGGFNNMITGLLGVVLMMVSLLCLGLVMFNIVGDKTSK